MEPRARADVIVRSAREKDLVDLMKIDKEGYVDRETWDAFLFIGYGANPMAGILVAEAKGFGVKGFVCYFSVVKAVVLRKVAVSADWRRMGIGTKLIRKMEENVKDCCSSSIEIKTAVTDCNGIGQMFLRNLGYKALPKAISLAADGEEVRVYEFQRML